MSLACLHLRPTHPLPLALGLALLALPPIVRAVDVAADPRHDAAVELDTVVVTASPLRGTAEERAQPTEILAGEALDVARAGTLGETVAGLPGVQASNFGAGVGRPIIRGMDGPRVSVLSGGLATQDASTISQDHGVAIEPFLADQIEVLKGPSTLLHGSGAIGGVVNVVDGRIAERPLDDPLTGRAELRGSDGDDGFTGMARVDASAAGGRLVLHADAVRREQDDYRVPDGAFGGDALPRRGGQQANSFADSRSRAIGASLVGDGGFLGASAARYDTRYGNPGEPGDPAAAEPGVAIDMRQDRVELKGGLVQRGGLFDDIRGSVAHTDYVHVELEGGEVGTRFRNVASDGRLELNHRPVAGWAGAIGLQLGTRETEAIGDEAFVPRTRTRSGGVFVAEQKRWGALQLDLGARVDRVESSPAQADRRAFTPTSLSAAGVWTLGEGWRLSANLDRAERAPAEEELFADGPHLATASYEIGAPGLRKERANQAEVGIHHHGRWLDAKVALYQTRFDDFIYLRDTGAMAPGDEALPIRQWTQDDARFRGFEVEALAHLHDGAAGQLDLRLFGDRVRATRAGGAGRENLPRIVPARAGADLRWHAGAWRASIGAVHHFRQGDTAPGEEATAGYTLVDAHVAWHWDAASLGWEAFIDARNLTDQVGRVHTSFLKDRVVLPGRNVGAGIRVFF